MFFLFFMYQCMKNHFIHDGDGYVALGIGAFFELLAEIITVAVHINTLHC